jgi:hypothetical protein
MVQLAALVLVYCPCYLFKKNCILSQNINK